MSKERTNTLLAMATQRLQGKLNSCDLSDKDQMKKGVSSGFRYEGEVFVSNVKWTLVKRGKKSYYKFTLEVLSLDGTKTCKVNTERIIPGGLGRKRLISVPQLNLEVAHEFTHDVKETK